MSEGGICWSCDTTSRGCPTLCRACTDLQERRISATVYSLERHALASRITLKRYREIVTEIDSERHVAASLPYSWHGSVDEEDGWRLKRLPHGVVKSSVERAGGGGFICSMVKK